MPQAMRSCLGLGAMALLLPRVGGCEGRWGYLFVVCSPRWSSSCGRVAASRRHVAKANEIAGSVKHYDRHVFVLDPVRGHESWPTHMEESGFFMVSHYLKAVEAAKAAMPSTKQPYKLKFTVAEAKNEVGENDAKVYPEKHSVLVFSPSLGLSIDGLDRAAVPQLIDLLLLGDDEAVSSQVATVLPGASVEALEGRMDIFVCAHKGRDRRCAACGPRAVGWLRESAASKGINARVWPCSHLGGHRYAGNVVTYPGGDWWGHVNTNEAATQILEEPRRTQAPSAAVRKWWRGRIGMDEAQQEELHRQAGAPS